MLYTISFLLLSGAVTQRRDKSILYSRLLISAFFCCILISLDGLYIRFLDKGIGLFGGLYHATAITNTFHIFIFFLTCAILQLNGFYPRKIWLAGFSSIFKILFYKLVFFNTYILNKMSGQFKIIEYSLIVLFVLTGAVFVISSSDLVSIFLSIELQSYGLYILCTVYRNSERATSGGLTYFLLGGLSSCFILLGSSLLYGNSGNTSLDGLYIINNISNDNFTKFFEWYESNYLSFSLIIMSVGFLFKISAAPFHFWSPDVYDAIPTIVTSFVAILAKISVLILLLELVHYTTNFLSQDNFSWTITLLVSSLLSLIIGSVLGLTQFRIKRLYAYSTISHIGFILLALAINTIESIQSFIFYLIQYSISNLNAFILLILIGFSLYCYVEKDSRNRKEKTFNDPSNTDVNTDYADSINAIDSHKSEQIMDKDNSPIQLISQIKGYFHINPMLSLSLAITLFSFAGVPPLMGFFAKQMILSSALDSGYVFMALIAILTSVISAYYYLAIVKQMFFYETKYKLNPVLEYLTIHGKIISRINNKLSSKVTLKVNDIKLTSGLTITVSILTLVILLFILIPEEWLNMANILALILFNT
jgi:NADH-ubiquinone oxidoreductase chain 2